MRHRKELIEKINPDRIYVENVRAVLRLPHGAARVLCEMAVKDGLFRKRVGFLCPEDRNIIASFAPSDELPERVTCEVCELDERAEYEFETRNLQKLDFYQLAG